MLILEVGLKVISYYLLVLGLLGILSACDKGPGVNDYIMPETVYDRVTRLDKDLVVEDVRKFGQQQPFLKEVARAFEEAEVQGAANLVYVFENGASQVDVNLFVYETPLAAQRARVEKYENSGLASTEPSVTVGDYAYGLESGLVFYAGPIEVVMRPFGEVDIETFANVYAQWLGRQL